MPFCLIFIAVSLKWCYIIPYPFSFVEIIFLPNIFFNEEKKRWEIFKRDLREKVPEGKKMTLLFLQ